jgi:hypothetical protein
MQRLLDREQGATRFQREGGIELLLGDLAEPARLARPGICPQHVNHALSSLTVSNKRSRSARLAESACTPVTFRPICSTASSSASFRDPAGALASVFAER